MKVNCLQKAKLFLTIQNNLFLFRIIFKAAPDLLIIPPLNNALQAFTGFLTGTYLLQYIINAFQCGKPFRTLLFGVIVINVINLLFLLGVNAYTTLRLPVARLRMTEYVNKMIFEKNLSVDLACFEDKAFFDLYVKAANDMRKRMDEVLNCLCGFVWEIVSFGLFSFFVLSIDPMLIVFVLIPFIVTYVLGKRKNKISHEYNMKLHEEARQRDYTRRTYYLVDFAKEMRLTNIHRVMFKRFDRSVTNILGYIRHYGFRLATIDYILNETKEVVSSLGAMLYAIYQTLVTGKLLYGDCLVVINSIEQLVYTLEHFASSITRWHENSLYIDTLRAYLEYEPKVTGGHLEPPKEGILELRDVSFRYPGQDHDVLDRINITIRNGEKIALVGHNGAGKSTLVKLLLRLYDPTEGSVLLGGRDIREYTLSGDGNYRKRFSAVFQDFKLFSLSVADNILLRKRLSDDETLVASALADSGMDAKVATLEHGMDTILTREFDPQGEVLSGGEAQKISIARALAQDSSIILLDEPSSALDPVAEYQMYQTMMDACKDKTVVFISHRLSSAVLADRIYLLDNGRVIEEGNHTELLNKDGEYAKLFRMQAQNYVADNSQEV